MSDKDGNPILIGSSPYTPKLKGLAALSAGDNSLFGFSGGSGVTSPVFKENVVSVPVFSGQGPVRSPTVGGTSLPGPSPAGDDGDGGDGDGPSSNLLSGLKDLFTDKHTAGNIAGLASTFAQVAALPEALKNARLQNKALQFNIDTAKQEQARRNKNIQGFNRPTSAFAGN